jgi:hypothetical protein
MIESDISIYPSKRAGGLAVSLTGGFVLPVAAYYSGYLKDFKKL